MKLRTLDVENLLSFDQFHLNFDDHLTVLVGPNGSGKSNVVRMLDLVRTAITWADERWTRSEVAAATEQVLAEYAQARHRGTEGASPARVRVGIELTTDPERQRVVAFMQAAILSTVLGELSSTNDQTTLADWVSDQVVPAALAPLDGGTMVLEYPGVPDAPWQVGYEFACAGATYRWVLAGTASSGLIRVGEGVAGGTPLPSDRLSELLFGIAASGGTPPSLPDPLPPFTLNALCPAADRTVQIQMGGSNPGRLQLELSPFRRFADLNRVRATTGGRERNYSLARPLRLVLDDALVVVGEQLRGVGTRGAPARPAGLYRWQELTSPLPRHEPYALPLRLLALKNGTPVERERYRRIQQRFAELAPGRTVEVQFRATELPASSPAAGGGASVGVTASTPWSPATEALNFVPAGMAPNTSEPPASPELGAEVNVLVGEDSHRGDEDSAELPIFLVGAGSWEALVVAEAVTDDEDRVVLLDEPALNLHPTWQHVLRSQLVAASGQTILITHSPHLVPMANESDLHRLVRLDAPNGATRVHHLPRRIDRKAASRITKEFDLSSDARALLFARGAILTEGQTELGVLPTWFSQAAAQQARPTPGQLDLAFYSVDSDTHFTPLLTVLHGLGVPWVVICDGAIFDVDKRADSHIFRQVLGACVQAPDLADFVRRRVARGAMGVRGMTAQVFDEERDLGRRYGIYTLAVGWTTADTDAGTSGDESFEVFLDSVAPGARDKARAEVGDSKVRQGRWMAENVPCPDAVADLYASLIHHLQGALS
jgi:hypothetical protein